MNLNVGRGLALGHRGQHDDGLEALSKAIAIARHADQLNAHAEAFEAQAEVLRLAGRNEEAARSRAEATDLYRRKENTAALRRMGVTLSDP